MCLTTQHYYLCGCENGPATYELCEAAFLDQEKAVKLFTYDSSWQYLHCKKAPGKPYVSKSRVCVDCKRREEERMEREMGSGNGNGNGKLQGRLLLENGRWVMRG